MVESCLTRLILPNLLDANDCQNGYLYPDFKDLQQDSELLDSFLGQRPYRPRQLRQPGKDRHRPQPLLVVDRRIPAHDLACFYIVGDPSLRRCNYTVADMAMSGHADLPGENHIVANMS